MKGQIIERFKIIEGINSIIDEAMRSEPVELTFHFKKKISREVAEDIIGQCINLIYGRTPSELEIKCLLDYGTPIEINGRRVNKDLNKIVSDCMAEIDEYVVSDCIYTL